MDTAKGLVLLVSTWTAAWARGNQSCHVLVVSADSEDTSL